MNDHELDKLIKESLTAEEAAYYDELEDPNLLNKMSLIYKGKLKWIAFLQTFAMIVLFAFGVYAAIQFFNGNDIVLMLKWGFGAIMALFASSYVKLVLINHMYETNLLREMKRLELQLAHLAMKK